MKYRARPPTVITRQHASSIIHTNPDERQKQTVMMRKTVALIRNYADRMRRRPLATGFIFAARTPLGRSVKVFLFGLGVILPLGSLIWALLFWHGNTIIRPDSPSIG